MNVGAIRSAALSRRGGGLAEDQSSESSDAGHFGRQARRSARRLSVLTRSRTALRPSALAAAKASTTSSGRRDRLAAGVQNDVARLHAALGGGAVGIDLGDAHAVLAVLRALQLQAELGERSRVRRRWPASRGSPRCFSAGHRAERHVDGLSARRCARSRVPRPSWAREPRCGARVPWDRRPCRR